MIFGINLELFEQFGYSTIQYSTILEVIYFTTYYLLFIDWSSL